MILADKDSIYSAIQNVSGHTLVCSWLPGHGGELANNEIRYIFGNVLDVISRGNAARRVQESFAALLDGPTPRIKILQTPAPLIRDTVTGITRTIKSTSGTLSAIDPSFFASDSLNDDVNHVITPRGHDERDGVPA